MRHGNPHQAPNIAQAVIPHLEPLLAGGVYEEADEADVSLHTGDVQGGEPTVVLCLQTCPHLQETHGQRPPVVLGRQVETSGAPPVGRLTQRTYIVVNLPPEVARGAYFHGRDIVLP